MTETIHLSPAKLRGSLLLEDTAKEALVLDWDAVVKRLAPEKTIGAKISIRSARPGDFIGVREKNGALVTFLVHKENQANIDWLLKKLPDFGDSIREVFRVEQVCWDAKMVELAG